jgi:hypothetical protein
MRFPQGKITPSIEPRNFELKVAQAKFFDQKGSKKAEI